MVGNVICTYRVAVDPDPAARCLAGLDQFLVAVVMRLAQGLPVAGIPEQIHVAFVRDDVVNY